MGLEKYPALCERYCLENSRLPICWSGKGSASSVYHREGIAPAAGSRCEDRAVAPALRPQIHPVISYRLPFGEEEERKKIALQE